MGMHAEPFGLPLLADIISTVADEGPCHAEPHHGRPQVVAIGTTNGDSAVSLLKNPPGHGIGLPMKAMVDDFGYSNRALLSRDQSPCMSSERARIRATQLRTTPAPRRRYRFSRRKRFRLRAARSDDAGRRPVERR